MVKNDAQLKEGETFDSIMENRVQPTTNRRKEESKALLTNSVKYQEEMDNLVRDLTENCINFFKELGKKMDKNKEKLKQTEVAFQVALAQCGDNHEEITQGHEDDLEKKITEMKHSINHVALNEKLEACFEILDRIQRSYRNYNDEYVKIVDNHPDSMNAFYDDFEADVCSVYKLHKAALREQVEARLQKETNEKQAKLEAKALRKYEKEKAAEEAKLAAEGGAKVAPKKAAPAKKGKEPERPPIDVPQLEVPKLTEYKSLLENDYLREVPLLEIATKIVHPPPEQSDDEDEKENSQKE